MFTLEEVIDLAIKIEENGEKVYRVAAEKVMSGPIRDLLEKLAHDEAEHVKWFRKLKQEADRTEENRELYEMGRRILNAIVGDQSFSLGDIELSEITDTKALLETALEFERDTMLFYDMLSTAIDEEVIPYMSRIMEEENRHIKELEDALSAQVVESSN